MLHKCANQSCSNRFLRLTSGKLFQVEIDSLQLPHAAGQESTARRRPSRQIEHYWLCDSCSQVLTLTYERGRGICAIPLPDPARKKPSDGVRRNPMEADVGRWEKRKARAAMEGQP